MLPLLTLGLIAWGLWRGAGGLGLALMGAGFVVQVLLALRYAGTLGPGGGHAEWVRERSARRRLGRSPLWLAGIGLVAAGFAVVVLAG